MKSFIKKIGQAIIRPLANRLGFRDEKYFNNEFHHSENFHKNTLLNNFYRILKSAQFTPRHIVDVGANNGGWTREALKEFPDCMFTLLEPQAAMVESIKDLLESNSKISFNALGAGNKAGTFKFTIVDRGDSCNFRFSEREAKERGFQQVDISIVTLNHFLSQKKLPVPDIIKIDAEGLDLEVLEGASDFLGRTEIFLVEAGIVNKIFKNSFLEVITFMDKKGYNLFDLTDLNRPFDPGILWLAELVFVKKRGHIDSFKWI